MNNIFSTASKNYCAVIVKIENLFPVAGLDNLQKTLIFNNAVLVGKDTQIGDIGAFFPLETALSQEFLSVNNLFRDKTLNNNQEKKGYFEQHGRVRATKFKGVPSEGFFIPVSAFDYAIKEPLQINDEFDTLNGKTICKKYIVRGDRVAGEKKLKADKKVVKKFDRLLENQFRLMFETDNFRRNSHLLNPDDVISITNKLHGSSFVVGRVIVKTQLNWFKSLLKTLMPRDIVDTKYDLIWSSRKVIKNKYITPEQKNEGYYGWDLWGDIANTLKDNILEGITIYGEAVGQLPSGGWIQKNYDYGTKPNQYEIYVYRITYTNPSGKMIELSWPQIKNYCNKYEMKHVPEIYYGKAKDYCPSIPLEQHWQQNFLNKLEKDFILNRDCPLCANKVPEEGIVISRETSLWEKENWKLKNWAFLDKETRDLDRGEIDLETEQSVAEEGEAGE